MEKKIVNVTNNDTTNKFHDSEFARSFTVAGKDLLGALAYKNRIVNATQVKTRSILEREEDMSSAPVKIDNVEEGVHELIERLFNLKESYDIQVSRYRSLGWLLQRDGIEGIIGVDQNFYPLPTLAQVQEILVEQADLLTYKYSQGFKKFMLVPFGMSYVEMYNKLETEYQRFAEDKDGTLGGLYRTAPARTKLTTIKKVPYFSDSMKKEAELMYYPETLYSTDPEVHLAKSKKELLTSNRLSGWELHLVPENPLLAREGKTIGDRPVFEANTHFGDYLDRMKGREGTEWFSYQPVINEKGINVYQGEVGLIPELWAVWALEILYTKSQVLHDCGHSEGIGAVLLGTWIKNMLVAVSYFNHIYDQVRLSDRGADKFSNAYTGASSVKVC